jgi:glucose-6-phosphate 1-dehydrogenase
MTPTFAAVKLRVDQERWQGVPIFLRSGKFLRSKATYIVIELKHSEHQSEECPTNKIIIELSPEERIHIRLVNESQNPTKTDISTSQSLSCDGDYCLSEHGLLFLDVLREKRENFLSFAEILSCWHLIDTVIDFSAKTKPEQYAKQSHGPTSQQRLLTEKHQWHDL